MSANWCKGEAFSCRQFERVPKPFHMVPTCMFKARWKPRVLKALHPICVTIAFLSRQVFKPHLKPYTNSADRICGDAPQLEFYFCFFLERGEMLEIYKRGSRNQSNCDLPPALILSNNFNRVFFRCRLSISETQQRQCFAYDDRSLLFFFFCQMSGKYHTA